MKFLNWLKKFHTPQSLKKNRSLKIFGSLLGKPYLWNWRRQSVSNAAFWGSICALTPWPLQMFQAFIFAYFLRVHLPTVLASVWISNPITMPFVFYGAYVVGTWILGVQPVIEAFQADWTWLVNVFYEIWKPLFVGCLVCGIGMGVILKYFISISWIYLTKQKRLNKTNPPQAES